MKIANIWKMRQTDLKNIAELFITTIDENQKKKGITDLNALLARLNEVCTGNLFNWIAIVSVYCLIYIS